MHDFHRKTFAELRNVSEKTTELKRDISLVKQRGKRVLQEERDPTIEKCIFLQNDMLLKKKRLLDCACY